MNQGAKSHNADQADGSTEALDKLRRQVRHQNDFEPSREKGERLEEWMMTYMDTVTLLVTLFVLILSFASMSEEKYGNLVEGLRLDKYGAGVLTGSSGLLDLPSVEETIPANNEADETEEHLNADGSDQIADKLQDLITRRGLQDLVEVKFSDGLVDLQLQESVLFASGSAELLDGGHQVLSSLLPIITSGTFQISVQGHTDSVPISTVEFPSNWELSGARAASVARNLISLGIDENRLGIAGFAHTRPLVANTEAAGRSKNRRVNILLHATQKEMEVILSK